MSVTLLDPAKVFAPQDATELAAYLKGCSETGNSIAPTGGGTKRHVGRPVEAVAELDLRKLDSVHHYDPGDLTLSVGAGITLERLQAVLAQHRQFLPLDPLLPAQSTIGGILASNAHGPLKGGYGGVREFCIGIEFVTGDGVVARAGGKVVKNVAGYDLMKLLIGSYGSLAVITAANFKVFPRPANTHTFLARFAEPNDAIGYRNRLRTSLGGSLLAMELISPRAHEYFEDHAVRDPDHYAPPAPIQAIDHWTVAIRVSGSQAMIDRYRREVRTSSMDEMDDDTRFWQRVSDFEVSVQARHRNAMVLYVNTPVSEIAAVLRAAEEVAPQYTMLHASVGRVITGNLVVCLMPLAVDPPSAVAFANAASALRARVGAEVSVVATRCPEESKRHFDVWGSTPTDMNMMSKVKAAMDPHSILNRGRYIVG